MLLVVALDVGRRRKIVDNAVFLERGVFFM